MSNFKYPLICPINEEQWNEILPSLIALDYNSDGSNFHERDKFLKKYPHGAINSLSDHMEDEEYSTYIFLPSYNKDLILSLAAAREGDEFHVGEWVWVKYTGQHCYGWNGGYDNEEYLLQIKNPDDHRQPYYTHYMVFENPDGREILFSYHNKVAPYINRKANKEDLIQHFNTSSQEQSKPEMKKYTIEELKNNKIAVRCTNSQGKKLQSYTPEDYDLNYDQMLVRICRDFNDDFGYTEIDSNTYEASRGYTIIDFDQVIFPGEEEKKIIGYRVPMDLFDGNIIKGALYVRGDKGYPKALPEDKVVYKCKDKAGVIYHLPKEIVETWEAVYEVEFKVGEWWVKEWNDGDLDLFQISEVYGNGIANSNGFFRNGHFIANNPEDSNTLWEGWQDDERLKVRRATEKEIEAVISIEIQGYKAEINKEKGFVKFGCQQFSKSWIEAYQDLLSRGLFNAKILIGDEEVTLDKLNKILAQL